MPLGVSVGLAALEKAVITTSRFLNHRIIKYPKLEETHKVQRSPSPDSHWCNRKTSFFHSKFVSEHCFDHENFAFLGLVTPPGDTSTFPHRKLSCLRTLCTACCAVICAHYTPGCSNPQILTYTEQHLVFHLLLLASPAVCWLHKVSEECFTWPEQESFRLGSPKKAKFSSQEDLGPS